MTSERRWRIGELARVTGVTVRTLHHYEAVGLLVPSLRTDGGHRLYQESDVQRLYRIRALRGLGLSLDEIARSVDEGATLAEMLRAHLAHAEVEVERITHLRDRLRGICAHADLRIDADELVKTIDAMSRLKRFIHARGRDSAADSQDMELQWRELGDELRACMDANEAPSSERAQAAALRARSLIHAFAGGDAEMLDVLARVRAVDPPRGLAGWDPELTRYLDMSLATLDTETDEPC